MFRRAAAKIFGISFAGLITSFFSKTTASNNTDQRFPYFLYYIVLTHLFRNKVNLPLLNARAIYSSFIHHSSNYSTHFEENLLKCIVKLLIQ